jgi:asparagine synthase (glutamine-hydrolysing)
VTVALSGDGGDELFFGYARYRHHADTAWLLDLPGPVRRAMAYPASRLPTRRLRRIADVLRTDEADHYARFVTWWSPEQVRQLTGLSAPDAPMYSEVSARAAAVDRRDRPGLLDLVSYLPDDILAKVDRASMAVSLEVRSPLLDHRIVEFALGLPHRMKRRGDVTKWILRRLLYKRVPRALLDRPKMGFGVPLDDWFRGPLRERMESFCSGSDLEALGINAVPVRRLWTAFQRRQEHRSDLLWQMFMLVAWSRRFRASPVPVMS